MPKRAPREQARATRRAILPTVREEKSGRILERVLTIPAIANARTIGCYVSVGSEVDTRLMLRTFLSRGVTVAVPVTEGEVLRFYRLEHPWSLEPGAHKIPEPREPRTHIPGDRMDALIIPGLRFGRDGSRLGNGGGHFDRYLAQHARPLRIALAFAEQIVDTVFTEAHDEGMDWIVSEEASTHVARLEPSVGDDP